MTMNAKQVSDLLEENGWRCVRIKGSHKVYVKDGARRPIVVPQHGNSDIAIGTLKSILREMGL